MFEKVLAPLDGSTSADQVIPYATELASLFNAELTLLGVCKPEAENEIEVYHLFLNNRIKQITRHIQYPRLFIKPVSVSGNPEKYVVEYAEKNDSRLIVLITHGNSWLATGSLKNTVANIIHSPIKIPLLIVKDGDNSVKIEDSFRNILIPLDGSVKGEAALPYIIELARIAEVNIVLFHAIEETKRIRNVGGLQYIRFSEDDVIRSKTDSKKYLAKVSEVFKGTKANLKCEIRSGDAAGEIIRTAEEGHYMIVMSSHGHSEIDTWTYGSVTLKVIQSSKKPIFLIKP